MSRPLFIAGTVPLYILGIAAARQDIKMIQIPLAVAGLFLVWLIQLMTHYNNEYCDLETDLATENPTRISGGSRVLVNKLVPRSVARVASITSLVIAVILTINMVFLMGAGFFLPGFVGIAVFLGWFYSARPLKLESTGWGEVTIVVVSCFLLPLAGYYLQTFTIRPSLLIACAPPGLLTLALILATEIPDYKADKVTWKVTLVVRLGVARALWLLVANLTLGWLIFMAFIIFLWPFWGCISALVSVAMIVPIAVKLRSGNRQRPFGIEKAGIFISLLLGYAVICFIINFLLT